MPTKNNGERAALDDASKAIAARLRELDDLLASVMDLQDERDRLRQALQLLSGEQTHRRATSTARARGGRQAKAQPAGGRYRNRDAVLKHLREQPGSEAGAIVNATGMNRGVAYNLLGRLVKQRLIRKDEGPNGRARYFEASGDEPVEVG